MVLRPRKERPGKVLVCTHSSCFGPLVINPIAVPNQLNTHRHAAPNDTGEKGKGVGMVMGIWVSHSN